jgi:hypothetical protein
MDFDGKFEDVEISVDMVPKNLTNDQLEQKEEVCADFFPSELRRMVE